MRVLRPGKTSIYKVLCFLCGYICCMLAAYMLSGKPLSGGALFLCACSAILLLDWLISRSGKQGPSQEEAGDAPRLETVRCCQISGQIVRVLTAAMALTVFILFALMATDREQLLSTMLLALSCAIVAGAGGEWLMRHFGGWKAQDPTWLTVGGAAIQGAGILFFGLNLWLWNGAVWLSCLCIAIVFLGIAFCLRGMRRMEELIPQVSRFTGLEDRDASRRENQRIFARLAGVLAALIAVAILTLTLEQAAPERTAHLAGWMRPVMTLPVLAAAVAALIVAMRYPLGRRQIEKLNRFLRTREAGEENPALKKQLEQVIEGECRQPWLTRLIILMLRPIFPFQVKDAGSISLEDTHSVVFLCNHGELFAPIVCEVFFPAPFRTWTVSMMMENEEEVAEYIYQNTFSRQKWILPPLRMPISRFIGRMSVTVMRQIESIPVYRDAPMKLRDTVYQSIEALEAGDNLLIFPEDTSQKYALSGVGQLSPGFVMLAEAYWKRYQKKMRMIPVYAHREKKTISFGQELCYEPENGFKREQQRIISEVTAQMLAMAEK